MPNRLQPQARLLNELPEYEAPARADYGTAGGTDDKASRVAGIVESSTTLAGYTYLGLGAVVEVDYTQPDVKYDLIGSTPYAGLDRFNRIIDSRWKGSSSDLDRIEYGYDRVGNRTYREVLTDSTSSYDELYTNDGLYRLADLKRGELNGGHTGMTSTDFEQLWSLDETGNWGTFKQDDNGNGTWDLVQDRTSNKVNEITLLDNTTGDAWGTPVYDPAGNITRLPNTQATGTGWNELTVDNWNALTVDDWNDLSATKDDTLVYDAWNRLVSITREDGSQQVNGYDALHRRMTVETWSGGTLDETRHTWFSAGWQALEDRIDSSGNAERQNVWGLRYIDDLVLRDRDTTGDGPLNERLYALQDANWNVTSLCSTAGAIQERCTYNAYGAPLFLNASYGSPSSSSHDWTTLFSGYHYDTSAQLYHVRFRDYSPQLGIWLQRDPIGYGAGTTSLYENVSGRPTDIIDPFGLETFDPGLPPVNPDHVRNLCRQADPKKLNKALIAAASKFLKAPRGKKGKDALLGFLLSGLPREVPLAIKVANGVRSAVNGKNPAALPVAMGELVDYGVFYFAFPTTSIESIDDYGPDEVQIVTKETLRGQPNPFYAPKNVELALSGLGFGGQPKVVPLGQTIGEALIQLRFIEEACRCAVNMPDSALREPSVSYNPQKMSLRDKLDRDPAKQRQATYALCKDRCGYYGLEYAEKANITAEELLYYVEQVCMPACLKDAPIPRPPVH